MVKYPGKIITLFLGYNSKQTYCPGSLSNMASTKKPTTVNFSNQFHTIRSIKHKFGNIFSRNFFGGN